MKVQNWSEEASVTQSNVHWHPAQRTRGQLKGLNHTVSRSLWIAARYTEPVSGTAGSGFQRRKSDINFVTFFTLKNKFKFKTAFKISNSTANGALRRGWIISSLRCFTTLWRNSSCEEHMEIILEKAAGSLGLDEKVNEKWQRRPS